MFDITLPVINYQGMILPFFIYALILLWITYITRGGKEDKEYFLANRSIGYFASFVSVIATETSVATIIIFPAAGMKGDLTLLWLPAGYMIGRSLVAFFYLKKLYDSEHLSIYRTIAKDHGFASRAIEIFYLLAKFTANGVRLFIGGYALSQLFGGHVIIWILIVSLSAAIYSLTGGLRAVVLMDQLQGGIILFMGILFLIIFYHLFSLNTVDFRPAFFNTNFQLQNADNSFSLLIGGIVLSIGTHGADQDLLQRVLAARNLAKAKLSLILSGLGAAFVILIYLAAGMLLKYQGIDDLNVRSPLVHYIKLSGSGFLFGLFAVLIFTTTSSTLDSSIHSTGAVWKSLFRSKIQGRFWSFLSLLVLICFASFFSVIEKYSSDFLSLAMGSMNYINGGLIGILTVFTFFPSRLHPAGIITGLFSGLITTIVLNHVIHPAVAWTWGICISSFVSFVMSILPGFLLKNESIA